MDYKLIPDSRCGNLTKVDLLSYRARVQPSQKSYTFLQEVETEANTITYEQLDRRSRAIACRRYPYSPTLRHAPLTGIIKASRASHAVAGATAPIAIQLQKLGMTGELSLLLYPPGLEFIVAFLGCLYAGVIAIPAYPPRRNHKLSRLKSIAIDAKAKSATTTTSLLVELKTSFAQNLDIA